MTGQSISNTTIFALKNDWSIIYMKVIDHKWLNIPVSSTIHTMHTQFVLIALGYIIQLSLVCFHNIPTGFKSKY